MVFYIDATLYLLFLIYVCWKDSVCKQVDETVG